MHVITALMVHRLSEPLHSQRAYEVVMTPEQVNAEVQYRRDSVNQSLWPFLVPVFALALLLFAASLF